MSDLLRESELAPGAYCAAQLRRDDADRYATTLFAPSDDRDGLTALYAFNAEIAKTRDVVTQPLVGAMRLQWWRESIEGLAAGNVRRHPVVLVLAALRHRRALDSGLFEKLIAAREIDLEEAAPATLEALEAYCRETSSPLVQLAVQALGEGGDAAMLAADEIGVAWALTGTLRATAFHAARNRSLLPADILGGAILSAKSDTDPRVREAVRGVAERAQQHLESARRLRARVPKRAVPALLPATLAAGHLRMLRRADWNVFDRRVAAPLPSRTWRLLAASVTGRY